MTVLNCTIQVKENHKENGTPIVQVSPLQSGSGAATPPVINPPLQLRGPYALPPVYIQIQSRNGYRLSLCTLITSVIAMILSVFSILSWVLAIPAFVLALIVS